jgi:hypothetical protein
VSLRLTRRLALAACLLVAGAASASTGLDVEFGLSAHRLRESADGRLLVRESGIGPRIGVTWRGHGLGAWQPVGRIEAWAADAHYDGRSQSGVPAVSQTGTGAWRVDGVLKHPIDLWRSNAGSVEIGGQVEYFVRRIRGVGPLGGLDERTLQVRAVIGVGMDGAYGAWRAAVFAGPRAPLRVRFDGDVYDVAHLRSGEVVGLSVETVWPLGPDWSFVLSSEHLRVARSEVATLAAGGQTVGTLRQPAWTRWGASLALRRSVR